ncbi:chemotaxis protein CheB [Lyngbya confervoides]|uniref:PAS domain-containing protein n=1 Tax=Lyngbya confervoides BDU141951 TaxID=1574623 RepID=A0ABD4T5K6_9CYAN|nr:chemotaxis protein CheB [Lyngbya confervoides]MCM1983768.1 PAS domain-containing protein [Lyngbya confervoides BDU141951]
MASNSKGVSQDLAQSNAEEQQGQKSDRSVGAARSQAAPGEAEITENPHDSDSFLTVGIGASAGGLEAFQTFFRQMDEDSGMAFVLISHLAPDHDSLLSELIAKETQMTVLQVKEEVPLQPNHVYVIPPNATLTVEKSVLRLSTPLPARGHRAPINTFFQSLAEDQGEKAICVILSGTGSDGTSGLKAIKEYGGLAIAQDSETAKYDSMPRNAVRSGLVDYVLPVEKIPEKLLEYQRHREGLRANLDEDGILPQASDYLAQICRLLRRRIGHDFSNYKTGTLIRRIQRRIQITQTPSVEAYVQYLKSDPDEISQLFKDLLIGVTQFFRDPNSFKALQRAVIAALVENCPSNQSIRIWIAGCSSGEEAYSVAILLAEEMDRCNRRSTVQIFATDIDEQSLNQARQGRYHDNIADQVTSERLERFFVRQEGHYQVVKPLREMCIFSQHSLISDPPFSRLDLLCCRNLLIYFDSELQKRLIPLFHYALKPEGHLFLGSSENLSPHGGELFRTTDKAHRIFQRKQAMIAPQVEFPLVDRSAYRPFFPLQKQAPTHRQPQIVHSIERVLLQDFAPACVIINEHNEIVYFFGRTGKYLEPSQGAPSTQIFDLAKPGLRVDLRSLIQSARASQQEAIRPKVPISNEGQIITVNLIARPIQETLGDHDCLMIIFQDVENALRPPQEHALDPEEESVIRQLEDELRDTQERLRSTIEEIETSNEELKSANEELLSMNEELQSSNEELQTSKEEMQSINEELETVNAELRNKVEELDAANNDIQNLFESTRIATVFLDETLRIKRFTPTATEVCNLISTDIGRPITDISLAIEDLDIETDAREVLQSLVPIERDVRMKGEGTYYKTRIMPYRTLDNVISGIVLTFVDVTDLHQARSHAEEWARRQEAIAEIGTFALQENRAASVCERAVDIVCQTLNSDACGLFIYQAHQPEKLLLQSGNGWPPGDLGQATVSATDSHPGFTMTAQQPIVVEDFTKETRFSQSSLLKSLKIACGLSALVYGTEGIYGILTSYAQTLRPFTAEDISFLQAIANILAATVQREKSQLALEKSRERLDLAIEAAGMGIWEMEIATGKSTWNDLEYTLLGLEPDQVGEPTVELFYRYIHPDDIPQVQSKVRTAIERKTEFDTEFRIQLRDGTLKWIVAKAKIIGDTEGNPARMIGVNYDVTQRKQDEEALKAADRRKDEFLAALGHELRNPLNALSSSIELLQTLPKNIAQEERDRLQAVASRQLSQLNRLVDDLLNVSRLVYQKVQLQPQTIGLMQLLRDVIVDASSSAASKGITLNAILPDQEIESQGDSVRLMQAFSNVLQNAIKFSDPDSTVTISAMLSEQSVTIKITDSGIGIESGALTRIFTAFSQEDRSLARSGGLGLGLPLAKGIIELHGGEIWAESPGLDQGSVVTIRLPYTGTVSNPPPRALAAEAATPFREQSTPAPRITRILIVEDDEDSAVILQTYLEHVGYDVSVARDGEAGIALAQASQPEVIISDISLTSKMDGYAVARAIRSYPSLNRTLLIATSGYGQPEDKAKAKAAGFDKHWTKPVNLQTLSQFIQENRPV